MNCGRGGIQKYKSLLRDVEKDGTMPIVQSLSDSQIIE